MRGEGHHCPHFGFLVFWHRLGWMDDFSSWYCYLINGSSIYMKKREAEQSVHQESCDRVKRIASDAIVSSSDSSGSLSAWLRQSGAKMDGLYFKTSDECGQTLGCFTNKAIEAGDILFTVPRRCLYGLRDVLDSELTNYILQEAEKREKVDICSAEKLLWTNMIASRLSPSANWSPYFDSLDKMSPSALSWPSDLLSLLDDTNQGTALKTLAQSLQDYHVLLVDIMQSSPEESQRHGLVAATCDLEALRWACGHYLSRRYPEHFHPCSATQSTHTLFQRRETNFGNLGTMVPLLDVLNHDDQRDWLRFDVQDDALVVISNYPRAPGDELFSNYGCLGNDQLLFAFGFAKAHNPFDEFNLKLKGMATFSIPVNGEISQELWSALRALMANSDGDDDLPREIPGDSRYHHPDEIDIILGFVENKLRLFEQRYDRIRTVLSTYGVEYKATFPLMDRDEEDEAGGEDSHPLEAVVTSLSRPATAPVDQLALYAAHYLAGQHNILCNAWKYLQSTLQHSLQCIEGAYAEDGEEDEEEEEEEQGDEEEK